MTEPLVTIAIPAFQAGEHLSECLDSLTRQTYPRLEIFVRDNASDDSTRMIAESFASAGVIYVRNARNLGGPANFDLCARMGSGSYVAIYHADDVYEADIVAREVAWLEEHPSAAAVFALDMWMNTRGEVWGGSVLPPEVPSGSVLHHDDLMRALLRRTNSFLRTPSVMVRRDAIEVVGLWDADRFPDAGDLDLWLRLSRNGGVGILRERLFRYRVWPEQWSSRSDRGRTAPADVFNVIEAHLDWTDARGADLVAYRAHRAADAVVRALNLAAAGNVAAAGALLESEVAHVTLPAPIPVRVAVHIAAGRILRIGIRLGVGRMLARLLRGVREHGLRSILRERAPRLAARLMR